MLKKTMVYEKVGHKGGPFAKKHGVRTSETRGDPLLKKSWCTKKWDIWGDPLLRKHGVQTSGT